jgi:hypothetical protein
VTADALVSARVVAPSLRKVASPSIVPTNNAAVPADFPPMMAITEWPWKVQRQEEIAVEARVSAASDVVALLWFQDRREPVPAGENYWIRYTASAPDGGASKPQWLGATVTFDQTLAAGRYAVIGFVHKGTDTYCARLVFDDQVWRPGTLVIPPVAAPSRGLRTHDVFYHGAMGVLGQYESYSPPRLEVLRKTATVAETQEGYLRIVRIGGPGGDTRNPAYNEGPKGSYG